MSRKEAIIRLGRSRSPNRLKSRESEASRLRLASEASSRDFCLLKENPSILNNSMHVSVNSNQLKSDRLVMAQSMHPTKVEQRIMVKENMCIPGTVPPSPNKQIIGHKSPVRNSPSRVIVTGPNPRNIRKVENENEIHLIRKVQVLEKRIQELHQEKQTCLVRSHEENRKLAMDNQFLRKELSECEKIKNNQIFSLQQEISLITRPSTAPLQEKSPDKNSLKNVVYVEENEDATSLAAGELETEETKEIQKVQILTPRNDEEILRLQEEIERLREKNERLNEDLEEMKDAVVETTHLIEENNKKIVEEYEFKIEKLESKLEEQTRSFCEQLEKGNMEWEQKVSELQAEKEKIQNEAEEKKSSLGREICNFQGILEEKSLELETMRQKLDELETKKESMCSNQAQTESEIGSSESCQRCKELIKTLVKLNQKTFSKTS